MRSGTACGRPRGKVHRQVGDRRRARVFRKLEPQLASQRQHSSVLRHRRADQPPHTIVLRGSKQVWSGPTDAPPERLFTDDLAWDKEATHTRDVESFLPIRRLQELASAGRIGRVAKRFHGVPTDYSQRRTIEQDAPQILERCREDGVDVALLVPL